MGEHAAYEAGTYRPRRSVLYMPSSNERALEKAQTLPVDALILDLEDAVAVDAKDLARENACAAAASGDYGRREITIRVNGIAPGLILPPEEESDGYLQRLAKDIPLQRKGRLENIEQTVGFLLENDYLTGQVIFNDGGEHLL